MKFASGGSEASYRRQEEQTSLCSAPPLPPPRWRLCLYAGESLPRPPLSSCRPPRRLGRLVLRPADEGAADRRTGREEEINQSDGGEGRDGLLPVPWIASILLSEVPPPPTTTTSLYAAVTRPLMFIVAPAPALRSFSCRLKCTAASATERRTRSRNNVAGGTEDERTSGRTAAAELQRQRRPLWPHESTIQINKKVILKFMEDPEGFSDGCRDQVTHPILTASTGHQHTAGGTPTDTEQIKVPAGGETAEASETPALKLDVKGRN